ncbi:MAG: ribosome maturation factor RimM [Acidobacteriaceae bacterium]
MTETQPWTAIACVIRPQGRQGEVLADILTDFPERFATTCEAFLRRGEGNAPSPVVLEKAWLHKGKVVLKFAQVDSISAADELRGAELVIPAGQRVALEEGAAYVGDLIDCSIIDVGQAPPVVIGAIREVIRQEKTADLLVVFGSDGIEHSIPFAKAYLARLDLPGRRVEMNLPPGLLEVNAPVTEDERRSLSQHEITE